MKLASTASDNCIPSSKIEPIAEPTGFRFIQQEHRIGHDGEDCVSFDKSRIRQYFGNSEVRNASGARDANLFTLTADYLPNGCRIWRAD